MANPALIARASLAILSDERMRKAVGWVLVAVLSPIILVIAFLCALASGSAAHNVSAAELEDMVLSTMVPSGGFLTSEGLRKQLTDVQAALAENQKHSDTETAEQAMT